MSDFVSRGGLKLQSAIENFVFQKKIGKSQQLKIENFVVLDVGSSTGGFVDCLLQNGASKVYALDTAYGELAWKLRNDPRVVVMERTNILHLESLPESVDLITIDAGWTKLEFILPIVRKFLKEKGMIIALLKPHYEADKRDLVKGVLPEELAERVKNEVSEKILQAGFLILDSIPSPILGGAGNKEFLLFLKSSN